MAPNKRTYGAKRAVVSAAAAAIFGAGAGASSANSVTHAPVQGSLTDITSDIGNLQLVDVDGAEEEESMSFERNCDLGLRHWPHN